MPRLDKSAAALRRNLQDQLVTCKRLMVLTLEETEVIMRGDVAALTRIQQAQQQCVHHQETLEAARLIITADIERQAGEEAAPTLVSALPALPARERETLVRTRNEILKVSARLSALNETNHRLLDKALEYVKFSLDILTNVALQPARYGTNLTHIAPPSFYIDSRA